MLKRTTGLLVNLVLGVTFAVAGSHVGPLVNHPPSAIADEAPLGTPSTSPGYPSTYSLGPGDSIGYAYYDYGTNGSANRNLINFGDGTLAFARMGAIDEAADTRGSYYKYFDGTDWSTSWTMVEAERRGWTNIDQIVDAGGIEVIMSHGGLEFNVDAARGANVWSSTTAGGTPNPLWPRVAVGDGFTIHCIYRDDNPGVITYYMSSADAGASWVVDQTLWPTEAGSPDAYDITAQGSKVAAVAAGEGFDVIVMESTDGGGTWEENVVYDIDETLLTPDEEVPDGSVSALYDSNGDLHVAWGNYLSVGDGVNLAYSVDAGIRHWSAASGVQEVAFPDPDTTIGLPGADGSGRDGNYASEPDLAADASGGVFLIFNRVINEVDSSGAYYQHIFMTRSMDGGSTWTEVEDITPGMGFDASFATVADLVDDNLYFAYFCDPYAGNSLSGNHDLIPVAVMSHKINVSGVDVGEPDQLPAEYRVDQNYPNPFNPSTRINYELPRDSYVRMDLFNLLGQKVAVLEDGLRQAGHHSITLDAEGLPSGTYFYRLQAGNPSAGSGYSFVATKKLILMK